MKNALLLLFCLGFLCTQAQIPDYFANNPRWIEERTNDGTLTPPLYIPWTTTTMYWFGDDVMVNNVMYKRMLFRRSTVAQLPSYPPSFELGSVGLFRQEGRSIIRRFDFNSNDVLLISYDYQIGDSIRGTVLGNCGQSQGIIQKIDSILINGEHRRVFYIDTIPGKSIIEGIGHMLNAQGWGGGFLNNWCFGAGWYGKLACYAQSFTPYWPNQNNGSPDCLLVSSIGEASSMPELAIYPNPFTHYFDVKTADFTEKELILYDISGKELLRHAFTEEARIQTDHLPAGIYIYNLKSANKPLVFGRLVKQ